MGVLLAMLLHLHGYRLIVAGPRPGLLAVTDTGARTVTLYETPGEPAALLRKVLAYETAHVLDVDCLTPAQRRRWQHLRHLHGPWYAPDLAPERGYGSGDFADVFSQWATGPAYAQSHLRSAHDLHALAIRFRFARGVCPGANPAVDGGRGRTPDHEPSRSDRPARVRDLPGRRQHPYPRRSDMTTPSTPTGNTVPAGSTPADDTAINSVLTTVTDDAAPEDGTND